MKSFHRRRFLAVSSSVAAPFFTDLSFLAPLSQAAATEPVGDRIVVEGNGGLSKLVRLIRKTPREKCVAVFVNQLRDGLSYQHFLSALFAASLEHGDPHRVAQVYSAHRISSEVRHEERLLPLFWVLDRIALGFEQEPDRAATRGHDTLAFEAGAEEAFRRAMSQMVPEKAEQAIVVVSRRRGPRTALEMLWQYCSRRASGTLGHHPIMLANSWRTLDALGWQHSEPVLRYLASAFAHDESDASFEPNRELVERTSPKLPADWCAGKADRGATIDLFAVLREGNWKELCPLVCSQLVAGKLKAQSAWDAVHLAAADLIFRYKTGGIAIGGVLVHAVTASDALRFGFECTGNERARLLMLLQAVAMLDETFIAPAKRAGELRDMNLLDLGKADRGQVKTTADVFELLPHKDFLYQQKSADERAASDEACACAFQLLQNVGTAELFLQTARGLMCVKASHDPHDFQVSRCSV